MIFFMNCCGCSWNINSITMRGHSVNTWNEIIQYHAVRSCCHLLWCWLLICWTGGKVPIILRADEEEDKGPPDNDADNDPGMANVALRFDHVVVSPAVVSIGVVAMDRAEVCVMDAVVIGAAVVDCVGTPLKDWSIKSISSCASTLRCGDVDSVLLVAVVSISMALALTPSVADTFEASIAVVVSTCMAFIFRVPGSSAATFVEVLGVDTTTSFCCRIQIFLQFFSTSEEHCSVSPPFHPCVAFDEWRALFTSRHPKRVRPQQDRKIIKDAHNEYNHTFYLFNVGPSFYPSRATPCNSIRPNTRCILHRRHHIKVPCILQKNDRIRKTFQLFDHQQNLRNGPAAIRFRNHLRRTIQHTV